jgi:VIT1/CCC1 family predicted Fe2+/Mn2+ transporter
VPLLTGLVTTTGWVLAVVALVALGLTGVLGAWAGGAGEWRAALRVVVGGGLAMACTAIIGRLIGPV